ncbi:glycosyltransferase, partial [Acinetobacter baumannii]
NEAANPPLLVGRCAEAFTDPANEVILVDNGSTARSPEVLRDLLAGQTIIRSVRVERNQGYGFGILSGLGQAKGQIL